MFLKYAYRPVLTTDTRKNQYARAFYQVILTRHFRTAFVS